MGKGLDDADLEKTRLGRKLWLSSKAGRRQSENTCKFVSKDERVGILEEQVIGLIQRKVPYPSPIRSIPKGSITTQSIPLRAKSLNKPIGDRPYPTITREGALSLRICC